MPINSMTGFARAEGHLDRYSWVWEIRSVNGKGLELRCRLPQGMEALDPKVREKVQAILARGNLQISLQLTHEQSVQELKVNEELLSAFLKVIGDLSNRIDATPPSLDGILSLKGVLEVREPELDEEAIKARDLAILASLDECLENLQQQRRQEGAFLEKLLANYVKQLSDLESTARKIAEGETGRIASRLKSQVEELLEDNREVSEERLAQEIVLLASKADIREELDRLAAHAESFSNLLKDEKPSGRKLDFLMQEFNREANTLCSKSSDVALTNIGLELKTLINQIREQVQNIE